MLGFRSEKSSFIGYEEWFYSLVVQAPALAASVALVLALLLLLPQDLTRSRPERMRWSSLGPDGSCATMAGGCGALVVA